MGIKMTEQFNKKFPELKDRMSDYEDIIIKNCLSKQRVKEAIEKIQILGCTCQGGECSVCYSIILLNILKKELGLEGE